jgi:hypothetical protein
MHLIHDLKDEMMARGDAERCSWMALKKQAGVTSTDKSAAEAQPLLEKAR